jgi:hypothetical protein
MLQLLPGGQAYLNAAVQNVKSNGGSEADRLQLVWQRTHMCLPAMVCSLQCLLGAGEASIGDAAALSTAAVRLVLELQLLVAAEVQRRRAASQQQRQQRVDVGELTAVGVLLMQTNHLLHVQIWGALQVTGSSCLPPEVVQQAGLQLLQALAAPLQLGASLLAGMSREWDDCMSKQLMALTAAAVGMDPDRGGFLGGRCCCCCSSPPAVVLAALTGGPGMAKIDCSHTD